MAEHLSSELEEALRDSSLNWESLEPIVHEQSKSNLEIAKQIHNTFKEGSGKYVLEFMIRKFLTKPIVIPGQDAFAQGIREGRADVVRQIMANIELAKQGE